MQFLRLVNQVNYQLSRHVKQIICHGAGRLSRHLLRQVRQCHAPRERHGRGAGVTHSRVTCRRPRLGWTGRDATSPRPTPEKDRLPPRRGVWCDCGRTNRLDTAAVMSCSPDSACVNCDTAPDHGTNHPARHRPLSANGHPGSLPGSDSALESPVTGIALGGISGS